MASCSCACPSSKVVAPTSNNSHVVATMSRSFHRGATVEIVDGDLFVCGGWEEDENASDATEIYDADAGEWRPTLPLLSPSMEVKVLEAGGLLVSQLRVRDYEAPRGIQHEILGSGRQPSSIVSCFDPQHAAWTLFPQMLEARSLAASCAVLGRLYVCGGIGLDGRLLRSAETFNATTRCWESLPAMREPRAQAIAGVYRGRLVVCGGTDIHDNPVR